MSITIRLARIGRKNAPAYKIVVANTKDKRNGKSLDILGHYNPSENPVKFEIDEKKYEDWKSKGALVTDAILRLLEGSYSYTPYRPKKAKGDTSKQEESKEPATEETSTEESSE